MKNLYIIILVFVLPNIGFSQINYTLLNGSWTECINYPLTDTMYMIPSTKIDSTCKQSYQIDFWIKHILTEFDFKDSVNVIVTTSYGTSIAENAPTVDSTKMAITTTYDTTWTSSGKVEKIMKKEIKTPMQIRYAGIASSYTYKPSKYHIDLISDKLIITQGDHVLNYDVIKLTKEQLILKKELFTLKIISK